MKKTFVLILAALAAIAVFGGLVHAVLVVANAAVPAATTVRGATPWRLWATASAALALIGVVGGGLALRRTARPIGAGRRKSGALVALVAGLIAALSGGLNLAMATGGPGSGNGVVGAAGALVLGLIAALLGVLAITRSPETP
jgi:Family of unknown function (DUF6223)